jgi:hypothetical protein
MPNGLVFLGLLYIFAKSIYMETAANKRKLIDIRPSVFEKLSIKAGRKGVSLKRYIEDILEQDSEDTQALAPAGVSSSRVISLIGAAKGTAANVDWEEERLKYLLAK